MKKLLALLVGASLVGFTLGCSGGTGSSGSSGKGSSGSNSGSHSSASSGSYSGGSSSGSGTSGSAHTSGSSGNSSSGSAGGSSGSSSKPPSTGGSDLTLPPKTGGEKATGSIKLSVDPKDVTVEKGKEASFTLSVVRTSANDDIDLKFEGADAAGVKIDGDSKIPAKETKVTLKVKADAAAKGGDVKIVGTEHGASKVTDTATLAVKVK